jgi:ABC-2 type transport system permease protein
MLRTILGKTLFEKRWTILIWFAATFVSVFGIAMIFPPIRDSMGAMMGQVPESMRNWFGDAATWQTYNGFSSQEIFGQMTLLPLVMMIVFGAAFLAGEESSRALLTTLSRPVRRGNLFLQKYAALVVMLVVVMAAFLGGAILGGVVLGQPIAYNHFLESGLMVFLLALALGTISFALGAATGRKSLAGLIVGFYAFIAYFIASLSTATEIVDKLSYGSLFRYVGAPEIFASGLNGSHILILILAAIVPLVIALPIFMRRDLNTR